MNDFRGYEINNNQPLVSVCLASFNNSSFIEETLNSIYNQDYSPIELIIVDDHSTDNAVDIIKDWICKMGVRAELIIKDRNKGLCHSLNLLLSKANGTFFTPFASDDLMKPERISRLVGKLRNSDINTGVVYSDVEFIDENGLIIGYYFKGNQRKLMEGDIYPQLISDEFRFPTPSCLIRKDVYNTVGAYDENLRTEDIDMWFRIAAKFEFTYLDEPLTAYRRHSASLSKTAVNERTVHDKVLYYLKHVNAPVQKVRNISRKHVEASLTSLLLKRSGYFRKLLKLVSKEFISTGLAIISIKYLISIAKKKEIF